MTSLPSAETDRQHMRRALDLAERGWGRVAPNPLVGCVVVRKGKVVGEGFHAEYGGPHAEVAALRAAGEEARGATVYVTLEPCAHHGKTPPCVDALFEAAVARVVFGASDPDPEARGGAMALREREIEVVGGVEAAASRDLNAPFFHRFSALGSDRPWIDLKLAMSIDARIADRDGNSQWITGAEARAETHRLRAGCDGVAVGIGTVLADDPLLTVRGSVTPRRPPVRIVFDRELRLPAESRLVQSACVAPVWVVCGEAVPEDRTERLERQGVSILPAGDLASALRELQSAGITSLFCEGGARLAGSLLDGGFVDRLDLFYSPLLLGPRATSPFHVQESPPLDSAVRWRRLRTVALGADSLITLAR